MRLGRLFQPVQGSGRICRFVGTTDANSFGINISHTTGTRHKAQKIIVPEPGVQDEAPRERLLLTEAGTGVRARDSENSANRNRL